MKRWLPLALLFSMVLTVPVQADTKQSLVVLTSFSEEYVAPIKERFEAAEPNIRLRFLYKKTPAAVAHILNGRSPPPDIFMASAVDAFESLKVEGRLLALDPGGLTDASAPGRSFDDPDRQYRAIALSGYGVMWNRDYLAHHALAPPATWRDLLDPAYQGHIGITSPTRSGTSHVIVELILQTYGWERGWAYLMELSGNLSTITARSFGVRDGIVKGRFGLGLVVDFFAFSPRAKGQPVGFSYLDRTILVPASGAAVKGSGNADAARKFLDFLISLEGQRLLSHRDIMRLPVLPEAYAAFGPDFPNPFTGEAFPPLHAFDKDLSSRRYHLVNSMFDQLITYRLRMLNRVWKQLHALERDPESGVAPQAFAEAREILTTVPVGAMMSSDPVFLGQFSRELPGTTVSTLQARLEREWKEHGEQAFHRAMALLRREEPAQ